MADRKLMWCSKRGEPAWLYADGSHSCWYDSIVEAVTEHTLVELPEIERLRAAIDAVIAATEVEGRCPPHHCAVKAKHRREWPVLWRAIDGLVEANRG